MEPVKLDLSDNMKTYLEMIEWTKKAFERVLMIPKELSNPPETPDKNR